MRVWFPLFLYVIFSAIVCPLSRTQMCVDEEGSTCVSSGHDALALMKNEKKVATVEMKILMELKTLWHTVNEKEKKRNFQKDDIFKSPLPSFSRERESNVDTKETISFYPINKKENRRNGILCWGMLFLYFEHVSWFHLEVVKNERAGRVRVYVPTKQCSSRLFVIPVCEPTLGTT